MLRASLIIAVLASSAVAGDTADLAIETKVAESTAESSLTVDKVAIKIDRMYSAHIERCYRDRFGKRSKAQGELKLRFTVEPTGKTSGIVVAPFDKKLDSCIAKRVKSWRFEPPKDASDNATTTGFAFELALSMRSSIRMSEDDASRFANMLTVESPEPRADDMAVRKPGADLAAQLEAVKSGPNKPQRGEGAIATGGAPKSSAPSGRISVSSKAALDKTSLTPDVVLSKIQAAYMPGLKRCYATALKRNPTLRGTLQMSFTVDATGRSTGVIATSVDADLSSCAKSLIANWRFPKPTAADAATSARFELAFALAPQ